MFCPKCGTENFDTNKFCKKCGKQLPIRTQQQRPGGLLGQVLDGKYRIEAKLGSGGMGDVYRATRLLIGDSVAIKVLHPHLAADPQAAERFRREAMTATQLRHRNIVALYDVGVARGIPYILMELAEGFSLRQIINEYRVLPLDFVVTVAAQVSAALEEAHRLGIVHRDIKPENIIAHETTNGWQIKILDFGIAKLYNQADVGLTQDGSAMGTPQYMAPEQCLGESLDGRSDIYSLGIVLYEMLCGTVPFKGPSASAVAVYQVQNVPPPPRSFNAEIHPGVEAVILRALAKSRDDRQPTPQMLSQELITAATAAFKSGFTAVSAEPIAAPDVAPEFDAEGTAIPSGETERPLPDEDRNVVAPGPVNPSLVPTAVAPISETLGGVSVPTASALHSPIAPVEQETVAVPAVPAGIMRKAEPGPEPIAAPIHEPVFDPGDAVLPDKSLPKPEAHTPIEQEAQSRAQEQVEVKPAIKEDDPPEYQPDVPDPSRRRRLALVIGALLFIGLIFILGIAAGVWFLAIRDTSPVPRTETISTAPNPDSPTSTPPSGMAYVAGGEFMMGSDEGDEYSRPAHKVTVGAFFIDITEVTNEEYKKFVDATGHRAPPGWKSKTFPEGRSRFPVTGVDWNDANAYAKWADKRLPTETEWEFAARGTDGRIYPWGNEWDASLANAAGASRGMREVGQGGKSPFGLYDMSGNAWEWTSSDARAYEGGKEFSKTADQKVIRGGWFGGSPKLVSAVARRGYGISDEGDYTNTGFRCAK